MERVPVSAGLPVTRSGLLGMSNAGEEEDVWLVGLADRLGNQIVSGDICHRDRKEVARLGNPRSQYTTPSISGAKP